MSGTCLQDNIYANSLDPLSGDDVFLGIFVLKMASNKIEANNLF